jgi:hypothetical protein
MLIQLEAVCGSAAFIQLEVWRKSGVKSGAFSHAAFTPVSSDAQRKEPYCLSLKNQACFMPDASTKDAQFG